MFIAFEINVERIEVADLYTNVDLYCTKCGFTVVRIIPMTGCSKFLCPACGNETYHGFGVDFMKRLLNGVTVSSWSIPNDYNDF